MSKMKSKSNFCVKINTLYKKYFQYDDTLEILI